MNATPKILSDIVTELEKARLVAAESIGGEGRAGSLKDEQNVIEFIQNHKVFGKYIVSHAEAFASKSKKTARKVGDLLIKDPNTGLIYVINIKTTTGSSDNATSKLGFLIALTDIPLTDLPSTINWKKWHDLITSRKANVPNRDYYFLVFDKNDMSHIILRGAKQITQWGENPSNDLQINWANEWSKGPCECSFDEAFEKIVGGIRRCKIKMQKSTASLVFSGDPALMKLVQKYFDSIVPPKQKSKRARINNI